MSDLTDDEFTCLSIAAEGQSMMAIGRWEKSIDRLVEMGLMERSDKFNNRITAKGRVALEKHQLEVDGDFKRALVNARGAGLSLKSPQFEPPALEAPLRCASCHQRKQDDWAYCPYCGAQGSVRHD